MYQGHEAEAIIDKLGGSNIAEKLGVTRQAVSKWKYARRIPAKRVMALCLAFGIEPEDVRPDKY